MRKLTYSVVFALAISVAGCGGDTRKTFETEIANTSSWEQLSPETETIVSSVEGFEDQVVREQVGSATYSCQVSRNSLSASPEEFVSMNPDNSILWLGNLITGRSHYQKGSLEELGIRERAPLAISIDLLTEDNRRIVENPSLTTVQSAIGDLIEQAVLNNHEASSTAAFVSEEVHSSEQAALKLGLAAEYLGSSASVALETDRGLNESTHVAYFVQRAFTVSMELPTRPSDVLSSGFNQERLQLLKTSGALSEDSPPLYVSSITYGRVLMYSMTSTASDETIRAAIEASYKGKQGGTGNLSVEAERVLNDANTKIKIAAFGGKQENIEALIREGKLSDYFAGDTKLTSMQPISFELRRLSDGKLANISRATEYEIKTCQDVTPKVGERVKVTLNYVYVPHACDVPPTKGDIFGNLKLQWEDRNGRIQTKAFYDRPSAQASKVENGTDWNIKVSIDADRMYGKNFKLIGKLTDEDKDIFGGKNETVGTFNANLNARGQGEFTVSGSGNCQKKQPVAHYTISRLSYIYP